MSLVQPSLCSRIRVLAVLALAAFAHAGAAAQNAPPDDVEELVVSGRRLQPVKLARESASVSVITRAELANASGHTLLDALRDELGVNAYSSGGPGTLSGLFLRGSNSERVLVLVDGVRVNLLQSGSFDLGDISTESIERVELLRGPQSTQFGADAAGGVIQIFTRQSAGAPELSARLGAGSGRRYAGGLHLRAKTAGEVRYAASVTRETVNAISTYRRRGGERLARDAGEVDRWDSRVAQGEVSFAHARGFRSTLRARVFDSAFEYDGGFPIDPDDGDTRGEVRDQQASWQLEIPARRSIGRSSLLVSYKKKRREDPFSVTRSRSTQVSFSNESSLGALGLLSGADFESVAADFAPEDETRAGVFVRGEFTPLENLAISAGLRREQHSGADAGSTTWQAGLRYDLADALQFVASGGSAFRAPSLDQLHGRFGANPGLGPERTRGYDLGLRARLQPGARFKLRGEARYFYQNATNLIDYTTEFTNVARARYDGGEFELRVTRGNYWLSAVHTRIQSFGSRGGHLLRRGDNATVGLGFARGGFSGELKWRYTGERLDVNPAFGAPPVALPSHALLDLRLSLRLGEHGRLVFHFNNLRDEDYEEIYGYGTLGRNARGDLRYEF